MSITLLAIVADAFFDVFPPRERRAFLITIAVASSILYLSSLGYLPDVYRWGFHPLPIAIAALIAIILAARSLPIAGVALCGFIAFDLHLLPSRNLFDYFIDPISAAFSIAWCASLLWRLRRLRPRLLDERARA